MISFGFLSSEPANKVANMEEQAPSYNIETIGVILNTELQEHLNDMKELNKHLFKVSEVFREGTEALDQEGKKEKIEQMKEYIEQALASIAYSTTHATQKVYSKIFYINILILYVRLMMG